LVFLKPSDTFEKHQNSLKKKQDLKLVNCHIDLMLFMHGIYNNEIEYDLIIHTLGYGIDKPKGMIKNIILN
jgi:hypothetical protein